MANRTYTAEFRARAVELSCLPDKTVKGTARDLGINPKTLHFWRHQARKNGSMPETPTAAAAPELPPEVAAELRELRKKVREQAEEIEILSKSTAWFAARSQNASR
ncbi:transposase [Glycomyces salinus]|uniref:transposase n=1 Tax=Glycomyces salinus TaxID=980294 RepID=UPI0018ED153C|nr:transposase [Glycomyces salinus]